MPSPLLRFLALAAALAAAPLAAQTAATTVVVVRHAEKAQEPEGDPVLSPAGEARARALMEAMEGRDVAAILVSEYARTALTAAPLAARTGIAPEVIPVRAGVRPQALAILEAVRTRFAGRTVVVVGHSNTVPTIVAALSGREVEPICEAAYANLYEVTLRGEEVRVERRSVGRPDPADVCAAPPAAMQR